MRYRRGAAAARVVGRVVYGGDGDRLRGIPGGGSEAQRMREGRRAVDGQDGARANLESDRHFVRRTRAKRYAVRVARAALRYYGRPVRLRNRYANFVVVFDLKDHIRTLPFVVSARRRMRQRNRLVAGVVVVASGYVHHPPEIPVRSGEGQRVLIAVRTVVRIYRKVRAGRAAHRYGNVGGWLARKLRLVKTLGSFHYGRRVGPKQDLLAIVLDLDEPYRAIQRASGG